MLCKKCGRSIPDDALYCQYCGKKQQTTPQPRHAKRVHGAGSITKLKGNRARPYLARLPATLQSGTRAQRTLGMFATYQEADEALRAVANNGSTAVTYTLHQIYEIFIGGNYFKRLSKDGQKSHTGAWKYLEPYASKRMYKLTKLEFQAAVDAMAQRGLKRETMAKVRNLSSLLCKEAMGMGIITVNYGALVQLPKQDSKEQMPFSNAELKLLWDTAKAGDPAAMHVVLDCYTGMRPGEMFGVEIEMHLFRTDAGWYFITGSKTDAGRDRIIPIPHAVRWIVEALMDGRKEGPLILSPVGKRVDLANWRRRQFKPLMDRLGIEGKTPYSCRHTFSNLQKRRGVDPEIMMEVMGHEDYSTTVEKYQTTTKDDIARILSKIVDTEAPE